MGMHRMGRNGGLRHGSKAVADSHRWAQARFLAWIVGPVATTIASVGALTGCGPGAARDKGNEPMREAVYTIVRPPMGQAERRRLQIEAEIQRVPAAKLMDAKVHRSADGMTMAEGDGVHIDRIDFHPSGKPWRYFHVPNPVPGLFEAEYFDRGGVGVGSLRQTPAPGGREKGFVTVIKPVFRYPIKIDTDWFLNSVATMVFRPLERTMPIGMVERDETGAREPGWGGNFHLNWGGSEFVSWTAYTVDVNDPKAKTELTWPKGVRRFSYWTQMMELPSGSWPKHDNAQIAFQVFPRGHEKKDDRLCPPGTMPGYIGYHDSDYIFALDPVAEKYGGGTEIRRLKVPGMPRKHFFPRQPASPLDGAVRGGKLVIRRDGNTRIMECAIPWTDIPEVKRKRDAGETIKFTFHINDDAGTVCMELARDRSVSKRNSATFRNDWEVHWANELEFGWQRRPWDRNG